MFDAAAGLFDRAAFHAENDIARAGTADGDHGRPVDDSLAAGAAHGGSGNLAAFGVGLCDGNVFGVQVDEAILDVFEPLDGIFAAQIAVPVSKLMPMAGESTRA